jgi:hypothetical protein
MMTVGLKGIGGVAESGVDEKLWRTQFLDFMVKTLRLRFNSFDLSDQI